MASFFFALVHRASASLRARSSPCFLVRFLAAAGFFFAI
jgi:hypothetical protein